MKNLNLIKSIITLFFASIMLFPTIITAQEVTTRETNEFTGVDVSGVISVFLTQAPATAVQLETEGVDPLDVITKVKEGVLEISYDGSFPRGAKVIVKLTAPFFNYVKASGVSSVISTDVLKHETFKLDISGASKVDIEIDTEALQTDISGASNIELKGKATAHKINVSGASLLKAHGLDSEIVAVNASGASKIEVNAKSKLDVTLSGTSNLVYEIEPDDLEITTSGLSKIGQKVDGKVQYYETKDTVRIRVGGHEAWIWSRDTDGSERMKRKRKPRFRNNWSGIDLGWNSFMNPDQSLGMKPGGEFLELEQNKSWVINFNLIYKSFPIASNNFGIFTGLGFGFSNYRLIDNTVTLIYDEAGINHRIEDEIRMSRNKFVLMHLNVPLMLEIQTHGPKRYQKFNLAAGMNLGILMSSYARQKFDLDGNTMRRKVRENYHVNPFKYEAAVRLGYGGVNLFATYSLNTLFKTDKGPELYPFSVGISLTN